MRAAVCAGERQRQVQRTAPMPPEVATVAAVKRQRHATSKVIPKSGVNIRYTLRYVVVGPLSEESVRRCVAALFGGPDPTPDHDTVFVALMDFGNFLVS